MAQKTVSNFAIGTQKYFKLYVRFMENGSLVVRDISADTATLFLKTNRSDTDAEAILEKAGDCLSEGATGYIIFTITPTDTKDLTPGKYWCGIHLERQSGAEYILIDHELQLKDRISDA
jgi:hypothetical protein